ncbi:MAG: hypothetical protein ACTSPV_19190 [Candidatus Hodarchaeales archaeon]
MNSWEKSTLNGFVLSAFGNFIAVLVQGFIIIFCSVIFFRLIGRTPRFDQYFRIFGFTQVWSLIGYIIAAIVVITRIPHGILFMDFLLSIIPRNNLMPLYRFFFIYFQIFGLLSLISFLYGIHSVSNPNKNLNFFSGKDLSRNTFVKDVFLFLIIGITFLLSFYTFSAYNYSYCSVGDWELIWPSSGPGTFFPWPKPSGHFMAFSRSDNLVDFILFVFFIQTGLLLNLIVLLWYMVVIIIYLKKHK